MYPPLEPARNGANEVKIRSSCRIPALGAGHVALQLSDCVSDSQSETKEIVSCFCSCDSYLKGRGYESNDRNTILENVRRLLIPDSKITYLTPDSKKSDLSLFKSLKLGGKDPVPKSKLSLLMVAFATVGRTGRT